MARAESVRSAPPELPDRLSSIQQKMEQLGARNAAVGLTARDDIEEFSVKSDLLMLGSIISSIMLAALALLLLHRMINSFKQRSNAQLSAALEGMPQGLGMFDGDLRLIVCNANYAAMYGLRAEHSEPGSSLRTILEHRVESTGCGMLTVVGAMSPPIDPAAIRPALPPLRVGKAGAASIQERAVEPTLMKEGSVTPTLMGERSFRLLVNPQVGLLFLDFETPGRRRVNGIATLSDDDPLLADYPDAQLIVRVKATEIFGNCPRFVHRMQVVEPATNAPPPRPTAPIAPRA